MPTIYLRKDLYDEIVRKGLDVGKYINDVVEASLKRKIQESKEK